jgi:hypothetical protein
MNLTSSQLQVRGALSATTGTFSGSVTVTGAVTATGDITAFSDARMKQNVRPISDATALVRRLRGVRFDRKDDGKASLGLIAQDVQKVLPEVVRENGEMTGSTPEEPMLSLAYGNLVALLIEGLKAVLDRLDGLEGLVEPRPRAQSALEAGPKKSRPRT